MAGSFDRNGIRLREIMENQDVEKVHPQLPVWEINGSGEDFERRRRYLLNQVLIRHPRSILRYARKDENLNDLEGSWENVSPSIWRIPTDYDFDQLYEFLRTAAWEIYPSSTLTSPKISALRDHEKRVAWIEYENLPFILQNLHMLGYWLLTINPNERDDYFNAPSEEVIGLERDYPLFGRLIGLCPENPEHSEAEAEAGLRKWVKQVVSKDDARDFIAEGKEFLLDDLPDWQTIEQKTGRAFDSREKTREWVDRVLDQFEWVREVQETESLLMREVKSAADSKDFGLRQKRMVAVIDRVIVKSHEPYESDAKISIRFIAGERNYDIEEHIETIFIPLYADGKPSSESIVGETTRKQLQISISMGPYVKIFGFGRMVVPLSRLVFIIFLIFTAPVILAALLSIVSVLIRGC